MKKVIVSVALILCVLFSAIVDASADVVYKTTMEDGTPMEVFAPDNCNAENGALGNLFTEAGWECGCHEITLYIRWPATDEGFSACELQREIKSLNISVQTRYPSYAVGHENTFPVFNQYTKRFEDECRRRAVLQFKVDAIWEWGPIYYGSANIRIVNIEVEFLENLQANDDDGDGTINYYDCCPDDPNKVAAGICGCDVLDTDTDGDGTEDCNDGCPDDPNKTEPGIAGCGKSDDGDSDGDGVLDVWDVCPFNPTKQTSEGECGCDVSDTDGDGTEDCNDRCPEDPEKLRSGACGCGIPDIDTDGDGYPDCIDKCPEDPEKNWNIGECGCGVPETENCGIVETDTDGDGIPDSKDIYPNHVYGDVNGDGDVDLGDVIATLKVMAEIGEGYKEADVDGDGVVGYPEVIYALQRAAKLK